jgi:hypothetical protein
MSESFVVSTGGSVTGGGNMAMVDKIAGVIAPATVYNAAKSIHVGLAIAYLVVMIVVWIMAFSGIVSVIAPGGVFFGTKTRDIEEGIGAAGTRTVKLSDAYGLGATASRAMDKTDTFLGGLEPPVFNDVPNHVLRKENRMQSALHAYGKLRKEAEGNSRPLPSWNDYWSDWQKTQNYDYSGRTMYELEGLSASTLRKSVY